jgi:hypothetical protein
MLNKFFASFLVATIASVGYSAETTKGQKIGSCARHEVLKICFDECNNPSFSLGQSIEDEAKIWHEEAASLPLYLTAHQKLTDILSKEFDPRSSEHAYNVFKLSGFISIPPETHKCLVFRAQALIAPKPTMVAGHTKIVVYSKCNCTPFENICIEALDKSRPMHLQGILPLYGYDIHKLWHEEEAFFTEGLLCHGVERPSMAKLPPLQDSCFKLTNARVIFVLKK